MGWLYVPGLEGSSSDFSSSCVDELALSCTWKGKPMRPRSWSRACKRAPFLARLSIATFDPSTRARFAAAFIGSLPAIHASRSPWPARAAESTTHATSGPHAHASSGSPSRGSCSSRTWVGICDTASTRSPESFKRWATALRRVCGKRRKQALRMSESASSRWEFTLPMPVASPYGSSQNGVNRTRPSAKTPSLETMVRSSDGRLRAFWPTPTAADANASGRVTTRTGISKPGVTLTDAARAHHRQTSGAPNHTVNPEFVEWLMGWPRGWTLPYCSALTASEPAETASCPSKPSLRSRTASKRSRPTSASTSSGGPDACP